ncbi:RagB/SusD family nutrient uptake outer membrane protein [Flavobacterium sp. DGU11]|uniref:RagB/SusD family nutrient uptake outer membrane protein n=1 Tax=Flavobacterium arundinis TaxID=3139143 RepID=A0ABU9HTB9_9FLAO
MKNLKLILFVITGALFVACDDAIDITQPSELPPNLVYQTVSDMQLGLNGVYASMPGENQIYFTSLFTDEVALGVSNGGQGTDGALAFLLNPATSGDAANMWLENYALINAANRLIYGLENVVIQPDDDTTTVNEDETAWYNHILAQAHALRAYGYLNLLTFFSEDMKNDSSLGVMLFDFIPVDYKVKLPRSTTGEIFDFIDADLAFAESNLSVNNPQPGDNFDEPIVEATSYVRKDFITAFKARMAAYRGDYGTSKTFVDQLVATGSYALANKTQYKAIWTDAGVQEVIFKIQKRNPGGNTTGNFSQLWSSVNSTVTGSPFFEVNRALFNLVNSASDVRQKVIVDASAFPNYVLPDYANANALVYKAQDVLPVGKYPGSESLTFLNDIKVFRMSEMYLLRAEYYASIGDIPNAIADVNRIRTARIAASANINPTGLTIQQVWAFILRERRMELAFEGHRYVDIRRLGTLAGQGVDRDPRDCAFNGFCTLPATDYRFIMPIPRLETAANPNIQQNPNY